MAAIYITMRGFTFAFSSFLLLFSLFVNSAISREQLQRKTATNDRGIENVRGLKHFFEALDEIENNQRLEPVRIMHYGDSHVAADVLTRSLREQFQYDYGDGGPGFIVPKNPMTTRRKGVNTGASSGWVIQGIGGKYSADQIYGPAGISLRAKQANERAWIETTANHFEVFFVRQPGGGRIKVEADGVDVLEEPLSLISRTAKLDSITVDLPSDSLHRIEVQTLDQGEVRLLGFSAERLSPGVSYDVLGINGARAKRMLSWDEKEFVAAIKARSPDLVILEYGTNELGDNDWTPEIYFEQLDEIVSRLRLGAPKSSILIIGPPERSDIPINKRLRLLLESQRIFATKNNVAFWSAYAAMGGAGSMDRWLQKGLAQGDHVHLTTAGYSLLASRFYEALSDARQR